MKKAEGATRTRCEDWQFDGTISRMKSMCPCSPRVVTSSMLVFLQKKFHRSLSDLSRYNQRLDTLDKRPLSNHRRRCRRAKRIRIRARLSKPKQLLSYLARDSKIERRHSTSCLIIANMEDCGF